MWKTRITAFERNEESGCYVYKNVFGYILFHQVVLEIYDLGKFVSFNLNQVDFNICIHL